MRLTRRRAAVLAALALVAAVAAVGPGGLWPMATGPTASGQPRIIAVTARPLVSRMSVVGVVEPGATVSVSAPFDGAIKEKRFDYGGHVGKGLALLVMDAVELDVRLREAQVALLRASRAADELKDWPGSAEVSRARRGVAAAKLALDDSRRKAGETRLLLDQGIVPRMEWETQVRQTATLKIQLEAAEQELKTVLDRGGQSSRDIADLERLMVTAKVDEADINRLRVGQAVEVAGENFGNLPIDGRITHISAQALPSTAGQGAFFEIRVDIDPTDEQAQLMRVGMSSVVTITVYENPHALVIPPDTLSKNSQGPFVTVLDPRTEQPRKTRVILGRPTEDGVEVLDGLQEKDRLLAR